MLAAGELVSIAQTEAEAESDARLSDETASLRRSLGLDPEEKVPPKLRGQFKRLEEDSTRRAKRSVHDALDRTLIDLTAVFRDVLAVKLGGENGAMELINDHLREQLIDYADRLTPEQTLECLEALNAARDRISRNVPRSWRWRP